MVKSGSNVAVFYKGTLDDGSIFDTNEGKEPLAFVVGSGQIIPGFDNAVLEMEIGDKITIHIPCAEAYGEYDEALIQSEALDAIPNSEMLPVGEKIYLQSPFGEPMPVKVVKIENGQAYFDFNHELAGQDLNFEIELVSAE